MNLAPKKAFQVSRFFKYPHRSLFLAAMGFLQTTTEANNGNALQACVATALGSSRLEDVPNFIEAPDYMAALNDFLGRNVPKLSLIKVDVSTSSTNASGERERATEAKARLPFGSAAQTLCILTGKSPRGDHKHCVVARVDDDGFGLSIVHDPHPDGSGLEAPFGWAGFFALRLPA